MCCQHWEGDLNSTEDMQRLTNTDFLSEFISVHFDQHTSTELEKNGNTNKVQLSIK